MNSNMGYLRQLVLVLASVAVAGATPIGSLSIGGAAEVTLTTVDFVPRVVGPAVNGTGKFQVTAADGLFAALSPDFDTFPPTIATGTIVDRTLPSQQVSTPISVMNWMTFDTLWFTYALDLTFISAGQYSDAACGAPAASGQTCTPAAPPTFESPYNLSNFIDAQGRLSSNANFSVGGILRQSTTGVQVGTFNGVLGAEFLGQSYQQVLARLSANSGTGSVLASYSGIFEFTAVPEPGSFTLMAAGLAFAAFGALGQRRISRR